MKSLTIPFDTTTNCDECNPFKKSEQVGRQLLGGSFIMIRPTLLLSSQQQRETNCVCSQRHLVEERRSYLVVLGLAALPQPPHQRSAYSSSSSSSAYELLALAHCPSFSVWPTSESFPSQVTLHAGHDKTANVSLRS